MPVEAPQVVDAAVGGLMARVARGLSATQKSLREYLPQAWKIIEPGREFLSNWHIDLISEYLEAVHLGEILRLRVNCPPRFGKSGIITINFPTWEWTQDPTIRSMFTSYAQNLCTKHSMDRRRIIESPWYQNQWGSMVRLASDQNEKMRFQNTALGHMITAPIGGSATGLGGNRLILDDPMNPRKGDSKLERDKTIAFIDQTLATRLDDSNGVKILVEQRLNKRDYSGKTETEELGWVKVVIPIQAKREMKYSFPRSGREKIMKEGELLDARRRDEAAVAILVREMGTRTSSAQLFQEPSDEEGVRVKRGWWKDLPTIPEGVRLSIWSWDTAVKLKDSNDWSVGTRIVLFPGGYLITNRVRARMEYPELKKAVRMHYNSDFADFIVIEDKSSGQQLLQDLARPDDGQDALPVIAVDKDFSKLDKSQRCALVEPEFEVGRVHVLRGASWVASLIDEFAEFPVGDFDDQVDSVVNGVHFLQAHDQIAPPFEEPYTTQDYSAETINYDEYLNR